MNRAILRQFARYVVVGGLAYGLDVGSFIALRSLGVDLAIANASARGLGAGATYVGNHWWTFGVPATARCWRHSAWRYVVLWCGATLLSTAALTVLTQAGVAETLAKMAVETVVVGLNFVLARTWVYRSFKF